MTLNEFLAYDTETDGTDVKNNHIVTAFLGLMDRTGTFTQQSHGLIAVEHEIPAEATAVHGITTEYARENGRPARNVLWQVREIIWAECILGGKPLVAFNAPFDLSILQAELERHELPWFTTEELAQIVVLDPMVLDKHLTPIRRGKSRLTDIAPLYGVPVEANAHDAGADCLMTGRILLAMSVKPAYNGYFTQPGQLRNLHNLQIAWKAEQAAALQAYFRSEKAIAQGRGSADAVVDGSWPIIP